MNLEQYTGCFIKYNGRIVVVEGARSNYDGDFLRLRYVDSDSAFDVSAFDDELLNALPDPDYGILKKKGDNVVFQFDENEYALGSQPYEPCLYIKKDGAIFRTLHNAFDADELPERFARSETLTGIDGNEYDLKSFCRVLCAAIASSRAEMDFTFAAVLAGTETQRHEDYKPSVMNFCPHCGTKNNGGRFCTVCGAKLITE